MEAGNWEEKKEKKKEGKRMSEKERKKKSQCDSCLLAVCISEFYNNIINDEW